MSAEAASTQTSMSACSLAGSALNLSLLKMTSNDSAFWW
jgi:hypothetical protein